MNEHKEMISSMFNYGHFFGGMLIGIVSDLVGKRGIVIEIFLLIGVGLL